MDIINGLLLNYYFLSFIIAWILSIIIKTLLSAASNKSQLSINDGFKNGGMPSSHTAIVAALSTAILLKEGFSTLFLVSAVFSSIIISDAFRIRQNVGIQGDKLNVLLRKSKEKPVDVVYGHTLLQVIAGMALGIAVAAILFIL